MAGISRSAYYKYKDSVYPYQSKGASRLVTIHAVLEDRPGVLMALISSFYDGELFSVDNEDDHWDYYNCNLLTYGNK